MTGTKEAGQLSLFGETADSPRGADGVADADGSVSATREVAKSRKRLRGAQPAMTMEEVANEENLREGFARVASNKGAPGADGQSIEQVRAHLEELLPKLRRSLLEGSYQPGLIWRVWIPKSGGQRGLGIPDVVDRWVQPCSLPSAEPALRADVPRQQPWIPSGAQLSHGDRRGGGASGGGV